jgi:hypothetical protein
MKKGLINEAFRLQQLAGIIKEGINKRSSDSTVSYPFFISDIELDGVVYAEIVGTLKVSGDYIDDDYSSSQGGWEVTDYQIVDIEAAIKEGEGDYIEDKLFLQSLIPKLEASEEANRQLMSAANDAATEFDSDFGQDPDAWHDRDR